MDQAYCDALRFAFDYEEKGEKYYREAAAKTGDKFAKKTLLFLADEEVEHIRKIEDFNQHMLGVEGFDLDKECQLTLPDRVEQFIDAERELAKEKTGLTLTDLAVYDLAMTTEKHGYELYTEARDTSDDERLKRFFGFLADEEIIHHKLLAASKKYLEDPSYYFEEAGGWIFG